MKVILREDVNNLGRSGDVVVVKDGYGRNFLIPRKLAVEATNKNLSQLEHEKRVIEDLQRKKRSKAEHVAAELEKHSCTIAVQAGEQDKLFGSVTAKDIADQLRRDGFEVDRRQVRLEESLRTLGVYTVPVKLEEDITANVKVWLVNK